MEYVAVIFEWLFTTLFISALLFMFVCALRYRMPAPKAAEIIEGEVLYKFTEMEMSARNIFEDLFQNIRVSLTNGKALYLSKKDRDALWSNSLYDMAKKNYTLRVKLMAVPLFFGGYSKAMLVSMEKVDGKPKTLLY